MCNITQQETCMKRAVLLGALSFKIPRGLQHLFPSFMPLNTMTIETLTIYKKVHREK